MKHEKSAASPRGLPVVEIAGVKFFLDERLGELRQVDNPHIRVPL